MMLNKLSLNTIGLNRIGLNRIGKPSRGSSDRPYIDPEVLASLKAVCICYGKSNDDPDRAIVKNLVDPDNPFIISNAAYKLNSGYGGYVEDYSGWTGFDVVTVNTDRSKFTVKVAPANLYYLRASIGRDIESFKIKITNFTEGRFFYSYVNSEGREQKIYFTPESIQSNNVVILPKSWNTLENASGYTQGFFFEKSCNIGITIEQLPLYQGAFVTDGVDDLITSTKTVQEMLGGSNEITVVSLITHISGTGKYNIIGDGGIQVSDYSGQTFMAGTSSSGEKIVELGDKEKLQAVQYTTFDSKLTIGLEDSSYAYYGTFVFNKENVPVDWIHQVIAYFNLDRTLNPDILCDVKKQGITNENHAEFGDKLIDFSGNGRDIQLNNLAWKGDSGIGKYEVDFSTWSGSGIVIGNGVGFKIERETTSWWGMSAYGDTSGLGSFIIKVTNCHDLFVYRYKDEDGNWKDYPIESDGIYTLPASGAKDDKDSYRFFNSNPNATYNGLTVEQIPSHAGALCLDGVNDFGKVTGLPIYKDYTVVADYVRTFAKENAQDAPILSKSQVAGDGAFLFNYLNVNSVISSYSFGTNNVLTNVSDSERKIYYQSKYVNGGKSINSGTGTDYDSMWLGTYRDDSQIFFTGAIYSLMSFPYSLSEFLIERQLKKHKLGTLYPDMVEWRPIVKSNVPYKNIVYTIHGTSTQLVVGQHYPVSTKVRMTINTIGKVDEVSLVTINGQEAEISRLVLADFVLTSKSPQKIDITIDEYIRYEDIVQPYPEMWVITQNAKKVSWGDKLKVGSEFGYNSKVNLLSGLYSTANSYYNGKVVKTGDVLKVEKQMVFACDYSWIGGTNEPKCILSPSRLRIPNSSYKILGYIPDISGHGNHGKINNSAYAGMSGANGYPYDYSSSSFTVNTNLARKLNGEKVEYFAIGVSEGFIYNDKTYKGKVKITGVSKAISNNEIYNFRIYSNTSEHIESSEYITITEDGIYDIDIKGTSQDASKVNFFAVTKFSDVVKLETPITIEQVGEYEGAYCLDGVDDFVEIPTTVGGKQVLMKVNWQSSIGKGMLYDQRGTAFAIWNSDKFEENETDTIPAYSARNGGNTYIDGILNKNILASQLRNITHNIVATNTMLNGSSVSPTIGCNGAHNAFFTNMSLYDFMLFDEISTDEEILTLNEYVGIEGNVTIPTVNIDFTDTSKWQSSSVVTDSTTVRLNIDSVGEGDILRSIASMESFTVHIKLYNASLNITYTDTNGEESQKFISGENYITEHDFTLPDTSSIMFYAQGVPNDGYAELTV